MQRFETKYDLLNAAYSDDKLKKGTIALLQYLVYKSNKEQCFPAVDTIAKALNVCKRTVQYNMRKLESAGYIIRKDRWYNHQQLTNQYVFNFGIAEETLPDNIISEKNPEEKRESFPGESEKSEICKINEIKKIYQMDLSSREKLLMVYLYHRANQKGVVYDKVQVFMRAVGVREWTLQHLLKSLHDKGLVQIRKMVRHGQVYLMFHLTGEEYHVDLVAEPDLNRIIQNTQRRKADQNQETEKYIHIRQMDNRDRLCENSLFRFFKAKIEKRFSQIWQKVRKVLRI